MGWTAEAAFGLVGFTGHRYITGEALAVAGMNGGMGVSGQEPQRPLYGFSELRENASVME